MPSRLVYAIIATVAAIVILIWLVILVFFVAFVGASGCEDYQIACREADVPRVFVGLSLSVLGIGSFGIVGVKAARAATSGDTMREYEVLSAVAGVALVSSMIVIFT